MTEHNLVTKPPIHWPSIIQLVLSLVAALSLMIFSFLMVFIALLQIAAGQNRLQDITSLFLIASSAFLGGILIVPSVYFPLARLQGWQAALPGWLNSILWPIRHPWVLIILVPGLLFVGNQAAKSENLARLLLPLINVFTVSIPILFLTYLGIRGLKSSSPQRRWGALAAGMLLSPFIGVILEIGAILLYLIAGIFYLAGDPERLQAINVLIVRLSAAGQSEDLLLQTLSPYLAHPLVIIAGLSLFSLVVPLIEEAIKPMAVWLLAGKNLFPREGFILGIISGAGFAFYENLVSLPSGDMWWTTVLARMGAALLHILTGGLTGWGLVVSWRKGRYIYLLLMYLTSVLLHAAWNSAAVAAGIWQLDIRGALEEGFIGQVIAYSPAALAVVAILMLILLVVSNGRLRRSSIHE